MPNWFWPKRKPESSLVIRLARVIFFVCYFYAAVFALAFVWELITLGPQSNSLREFFKLAFIAMIAGRAVRYILANE